MLDHLDAHLRGVRVTHHIAQRFFYDHDKTILYLLGHAPLHIAHKADRAKAEIPQQLSQLDLQIDGFIVKVVHAGADIIHGLREGISHAVKLPVERLLPVQRALSGPEFAEVVTCFSAPFYLEVLPAGASKGEALRWICADRGIDLADVAAIGDYENDLAMILTAGLGAAPANAQPAVREAADAVVAPHTEHAVADLICRYLMR